MFYFFFKQKTAYEMRISYWSSDVCSSDLDVFISNTPYEGGGTHLSDVVILVPVFDDETLIAWTVNKAHWTEVGGAQPGSVSTNAVDIYQEGLRFTFLKLYDRGAINQSLVQLIRDNVRLPEDRKSTRLNSSH